MALCAPGRTIKDDCGGLLLEYAGLIRISPAPVFGEWCVVYVEWRDVVWIDVSRGDDDQDDDALLMELRGNGPHPILVLAFA
jgi:hypothetical protein